MSLVRDRGVGTLVVVNAQHQPMGLVSDRDLTLRVMAAARDPAMTPVVDVMTPMPTSVMIHAWRGVRRPRAGQPRRR